MMREDDEIFGAAKPKTASHVMGELLDALSVDELDARIALLTQEIERLRAARDRKSASRAAADAFFRPAGG